MSLSLLQALEGEEYDTAFFLTYTLNLRFFEELMLPRLLRMGVRHVGILVDHTGYAETLRDGRRQEQSECGRAYTVAPVRLRGGGIQHAKAIWLSGQDHRVLVGSHNLTMSGFNDQIELTTDLRSTNPAHITALRDLGATISAVTPPALQEVWARTRESLAAVTTVAPSDPEVQMLTSLHASLEDQLVRVVGPVERLRVVTPFLDGSQLRRLVDRTGAQEVILDVPREGLDIPLTAAMRDISTLRVRSVHDKIGRRLHAKGYEARTGDVTWTAIGSANCTNAALAHSVAAGGNLEFLVVTRGVALPTDLLEFESVSDPDTFPSTGRAWNEGRASGALLVTRADYQHHQLRVEWEAAGQHEVACTELWVGDHPPVPLDASPAMVHLESSPPDYVMLQGLVGEDIVEARAWIINHEDLEQAVQRAHVQHWAEQISSRDPLQLAGSIDLWLTRFLLRELRQEQSGASATTADDDDAAHMAHTVKRGERMRDFHEVFTYSTDETSVHRAAEHLLAGPKGADPLAIFRALFARLNSDTADGSTGSPPDTQVNDRIMQRQYAKTMQERDKGWQRTVDALIRHLTILTRDSATWAAAHTPRAIEEIAEKIRLAASLITIIGFEQIRNHQDLRKRAQFVEVGLQWVEAVEKHVGFPLDLAARGPLALSLAVLGDIARFGGQQRERDMAATLVRRLLGAEPRAVLDNWRLQFPGQVDTFLTAWTGRDLYEPLTLLTEQLLGIPHPSLRAQLHEKWGLLMALQEADTRRLPGADTLYTQAADAYKGTEVWSRYQARRAQRKFPVLVKAVNGRCPRCGLQLSIADSRKLDHGEPVMNACQHVLLLSI